MPARGPSHTVSVRLTGAAQQGGSDTHAGGPMRYRLLKIRTHPGGELDCARVPLTQPLRGDG